MVVASNAANVRLGRCGQRDSFSVQRVSCTGKKNRETRLDLPESWFHTLGWWRNSGGGFLQRTPAAMLGLAKIKLEYRAERQVAGIEVAKRRGV
jgi:hypothetical protein